MNIADYIFLSVLAFCIVYVGIFIFILDREMKKQIADLQALMKSYEEKFAADKHARTKEANHL